MSLPPSLAAVQIWPIKAKGAVIRHNPLGDPTVEKYYHEALEDGRWLEKNVADANHWLLQKKQLYLAKIQTYVDINTLAVDGQLGHHPRKIKYIADSIKFLNEVNQFQKDIIGLIQAVTQNIGLLSSMEQNILGVVQSNLNALAILINNICNWGIPDLPAIPNLFSDTIWNFNGFNFFPLAAFHPNVGFDTNFAFNMCMVHLPNINIFRNYPSSVNTYSGLPYGTPLFVPPLGGIVPNTGQNLSDPNFISTMQQLTTPPVYGPMFNPNSSMLGAVPDPNTIISNFQMPSQTYHDNIVSIVPSLRGDTIEPIDSDYNNPNLTLRSANLRKDLIHYINLDAIVSSNFDPYVTSAWLFYLDLARNGRAGTWLSQYQSAYTTYIQPSVSSLANNAVPWNAVLGGSGVVDTPKDIPFTDVLMGQTGLTPAQIQVILWQLSYVEASLLGYTRSKTWDATQNANYLSGVTGSDLDYVPTAIDLARTSTIFLGVGTAQFPVEMTYPTAIAGVLDEVIQQATLNIAADTSYVSPRLSNRFTYNQFAQATMVDRFTQFWRDFNTNMISFLAQDPYLVAFTVTYFATLNGALNPLGDTTAYSALKVDVSSRVRTWVPGTPLLPIPKAPIVVYSNNSTPTNNTSGWTGITFDPNIFLARPDIQGQPIPIQTAMLRTNLSYAGLQQYQQQAISAVNNQIANAQTLLAQLQQMGFRVEDTNLVTAVPAGSPGVPVAFDTVDFDYTGNVTNNTTFTLQATGEYAYFGTIEWVGLSTGQARTVTVFQNGTPIFTNATDPTFVAPFAVSISGYGNFNMGDVIQVEASHGFAVSQDVGPGSFFSMILTGPQEPPVQIPPDVADNTTQTYTADETMAVLTAVSVQGDGGVAHIDPTVVNMLSGTVVFPFVDGITLAPVTVGNSVTVTGTYGAAFTVTGLPAFTVGGLLYVGLNGVLTQDYTTLITEVQWVICVGKAINANTFIYEPHLPQRILSLM
jgi:hypothetical protein